MKTQLFSRCMSWREGGGTQLQHSGVTQGTALPILVDQEGVFSWCHLQVMLWFPFQLRPTGTWWAGQNGGHQPGCSLCQLCVHTVDTAWWGAQPAKLLQAEASAAFMDLKGLYWWFGVFLEFLDRQYENFKAHSWHKLNHCRHIWCLHSWRQVHPSLSVPVVLLPLLSTRSGWVPAPGPHRGDHLCSTVKKLSRNGRETDIASLIASQIFLLRDIVTVMTVSSIWHSPPWYPCL